MIFVIFGGAGELSLEKIIPALYNLFKQKKFNIKIIATARTKYSHEEYRKLVQKRFVSRLERYAKEGIDKFMANLFYYPSNANIPTSYLHLHKFIATIKDNDKKIIYYLSVPASVTSLIISNFKIYQKLFVDQKAKIVIEKPIGQNQNSNSQIEDNLAKIFQEEQIYRIDHYLGKESIRNIIFLRRTNPIIEAIWSKEYIDHIQITLSEESGVGDRLQVYDESGVIKDMIQSHILETLAIIGMDLPTKLNQKDFSTQKIALLKSIDLAKGTNSLSNPILGQYKAGKIKGEKIFGYRHEGDGLVKKSATSTFFAGKFYINNDRWLNIPFYLRTGKRMAKKSSYIVIEFKKSANLKSVNNVANRIVLLIDPKRELNISLNLRESSFLNRIRQVNLHYSNNLAELVISDYTILLYEMIKGDKTFFLRKDEVAVLWQIVENLQDGNNLFFYKAGTWGVDISYNLLREDGREWLNI